MSKGDVFENDLLKLIFWGTAIPNIADNAAASPLANLYVSFHTADPGEAGTALTNEAAYTGYARQPVARSAAGWAITGNTVNPVANVDAPECTASPGAPLTHWAVSVALSGAAKVLYKGTLSPAITMAIGVIPRLKNTSTITED